MGSNLQAREKELRHEFVCISRDLHKFAHTVIAPICQRHGITMQQMYVLMELRSEPGQTIGRLSDRVGILHTNFPQVCRKLENGGLVRRTQSEIDRRSFLLSLTEEGERLFRALDEEVNATYGLHSNPEFEENYEIILKGFEALHSMLGRFTPPKTEG